MSRFNTLYLGDAKSAADELDSSTESESTLDDLRVALINALGKIAELEQEVRILKRNVFSKASG